MPRFFDKNNLTPEQASRWDSATAEYQRVQNENISRQIAQMSLEQKKALMEDAPGRHNPQRDLDTNVRKAMGFVCGLMGGKAGDCKSALFARLLDGKAALPVPPPTSYSYPWYAVVEEAGPFHVMQGGAQSMGSVMRGTRGAEGVFAIAINQCSWAVVSMNAAAKRLFDIQERLEKTAKPEKEGSIHHVYEWTEDLCQGVLAAYADNPEIIVRHGEWPDYKLFLGRMESFGQRRYMERAITPASLVTTGSVFDAHCLNLNLVIGEVTSHGQHPRDRLEQSKEKVASPTNSAYPGLDRLMAEQQITNLERDVAEFEADPDGQDFVQTSYDDWFLVKEGGK